MKRTYASGAEKVKISDNKRKALFSFQKVTYFFGPASVELTTGDSSGVELTSVTGESSGVELTSVNGDSSGAPGECIVVELVYDKFGSVSRQTRFSYLLLLNNSS